MTGSIPAKGDSHVLALGDSFSNLRCRSSSLLDRFGGDLVNSLSTGWSTPYNCPSLSKFGSDSAGGSTIFSGQSQDQWLPSAIQCVQISLFHLLFELTVKLKIHVILII